MKLFRRALLISAILGAVSLLSGLAFAEEQPTQADIKLLRDAASALQNSQADLAQGLSNYADKEAKELEEGANQKSSKDEIGEKVEPKEEAAVASPERKQGEAVKSLEQTEQGNKSTY